MVRIITAYALRNLFRKRLRTFFTLLSVTMIIVLYTVLTSIGNSFNTQILQALEHTGIDIAVQERYASTPVTSMIDMKKAQQIAKIKGIRNVESVLIARKRSADKKGGTLFILGVSNFTAFATQLGFNITNGRLPEKGSDEVVIGAKTSDLFRLGRGDALDFGAEGHYPVVGIYSSWLNFMNAGVVMSLAAAQKLSRKTGSVSMLFLTLDSPTQTDELVKKINRRFSGLRAMESQQLPNSLGPLKSILYFFRIFSFLTLFIAVAVMLTTFVMVIAERTKEVGILSAIGWPRMRIISVFFVESLMLSYAGGILGYLLSIPLMRILKDRFVSIALYLPEQMDFSVFINVMGISFAVALLSIIFPASYGTKISIAKALRYE